MPETTNSSPPPRPDTFALAAVKLPKATLLMFTDTSPGLSVGATMIVSS